MDAVTRLCRRILGQASGNDLGPSILIGAQAADASLVYEPVFITDSSVGHGNNVILSKDQI